MTIVITGVGVISPAGNDVASLDAAVRAGRSLLERRTFVVEGLQEVGPFTCATAHPFDAVGILGRKGLRVLSAESRMFLCAARAALDASRLSTDALDAHGLGIYVGTSAAGLSDYLGIHLEALVWDPRKVSPTRGPTSGLNAPASQATIRLVARGANVTVATGRVSALDAVGIACDELEDGRVDVALVGGVDVLEYFRQGFHARDGLGEAAAVAVLEPHDRALARGAPVLGRIAEHAGGFCTTPGDPDALEARAARAWSRLGPVDRVVMQAAADLPGVEERAIARAELAGERIGVIPVCGDCGGGTGALQLAVALASGCAERTAVTALDPAGYLGALIVEKEP